MTNADDFYKQMAFIVRDQRKRNHLSQQELAKLAGIGKTAVFDIEHGKPTVQLQTLVSALDALNITLKLFTPLSEVSRIHD